MSTALLGQFNSILLHLLLYNYYTGNNTEICTLLLIPPPPLFFVIGSLQEKKILDKVYRRIKTLETTTSTKSEFSSISTALEEPVNLFIQLQSNSSLLLGQDVPISVEVFNPSGGEKATHLVLGAQSLHYGGTSITQLWKKEFHFILKSNEGKDSTGHKDRKVYSVLSFRKNALSFKSAKAWLES